MPPETPSREETSPSRKKCSLAPFADVSGGRDPALRVGVESLAALIFAWMPPRRAEKLDVGKEKRGAYPSLEAPPVPLRVRIGPVHSESGIAARHGRAFLPCALRPELLSEARVAHKHARQATRQESLSPGVGVARPGCEERARLKWRARRRARPPEAAEHNKRP